MALLDRLGLVPKPGRYSRRAGLRKDGRRPRPEGYELSRRGALERLGLLAALTVLAVLAFPNVAVYDGSARIGEVWRSDDVIAPFDFAIRLPAEEVETRRDSVRRSLPPIFAERPEAIPQTLARLDSLDARLDSTFAAYLAWQGERAQLAQARRADQPVPTSLQRAVQMDSSRYASLRSQIDLGLSDRQWARLLQSAASAAAARSYGTALDDRLLGEAARIAREALSRGVLNVPIDSVRTQELLVRNLDPSVRTEEERERSAVLGVEDAVVRARQSLRAAFPGQPEVVEVGAALFEEALVPSLVYQDEATERARAEIVNAVLPTRGRIQENQTIIRRGDAVTVEQFEQLRSLDLEQAERAGGVSLGRTVLGRLVLTLSALALFFLYIYLLRPTIFFDTRQLVLVCLLVGLVLVGYLIAGAFFGGASPFVVPVALCAILLTIVFDSRVGSFAVMTLAALGGLIFGYDFPFAFTTLIVGVLAVFSVRDVKNRSRIFASAALVLGAYLIVLFGYALLRADPFTARLFNEFVAVSVNAALVLLAGPLLWAIERTFRVTTDMTLLELSDTNREVLKKLSLQAPGTFNHSLQVANLAEAAADVVGANALRARVGALYHDIGKMLKPEYFIENQQPGDNPHEKIKPSMSALVIAAHVKDGVRLGKEQGLPGVVLDFIGSHHGTSLIEFFYRKAQEQAPEGTEVDEEDYRYPGPLPQTNEEAIVMLADSVEAASRSLDKPTPRRLQALIDGIVAARVTDGQLDESALTFADLTRIKETFHTLLCGIYHFRVRYPDQDEAEPAAPGGDGASDEAEEIDGTAPTSAERSTLG